MKRILTIILFAGIAITAQPKKLMVGPEEQYTTIREAALKALPGDSIIVRRGILKGNETIYGLKGTADKHIIIMAETDGATIISGGASAIHLTDPSWVIIKGFVISGQTGNGINIDDGGSFDTPASNIVISDCRFEALSASGNNDQLKLSGLNNFTIRNSVFINGSKGGSMIDMVGCHNGIIEKNRFQKGGSNSIQAKGGSSEIVITKNLFTDGGERTINIGGSTGMEFFRPAGAQYEATFIHVWANIFTGSGAAVAFVGSSSCDVINNTIIEPSMWVMRILQENNNAAMQKCSGNTFSNNIVVFSAPSRPVVNIGPNTLPGTFTFAGNIWCNPADKNWRGPVLPSPEKDGIIAPDPGFTDKEFNLKPDSRASGSGVKVKMPAEDFSGKPFAERRSSGALEVSPPLK